MVLFTDGISETMNEAFDCFGEARLSKVIEQYAHLPFDQLRSYILAELRAFAGEADQHDDMTMILMRVGVSALTVVFRTRSEIEANVVQALLDSHGMQSVRTAGAPPGMFPFTVSTLGETRVSVREEEGGRSRADHRERIATRSAAGWSCRCRSSSTRSRRGSATASAIAGCSSTR